MTLVKKLQTVSAKVRSNKKFANNEDNTRDFLIVPFLRALGFDISEPDDVDQQYRAHRGRADLALKKDGKTIAVIEFKSATVDISKYEFQLKHYFYNVEQGVRFGILTNGLQYRFYADLERIHILDNQPFMILDMLKSDDSLFADLVVFTKSGFEVNRAVQWAQYAKDRGMIRRVLKAEFDPLSPKDVEFILNIALADSTADTRRTVLTQLVKQEWKEFLRVQGNTADSQTREETQETPITPNPDDSTFLEKTGFLAKYSLDGSVEVPVFADVEGHVLEARLSLWGKLHSAGAIVLYGEEWLTPKEAGERARKTIDPNATDYVNGMTFWQLRDPSSGELRPINDLRYDEELLRRVLSNSKI